MPHSEKPRVVVVSGNDAEAECGALWFAAILLNRFGLRAQLIQASQLNARQLRSQLKQVFHSGSDQPLLVVYNGHGGLTGWGPWEKRRERVEYRMLADLTTRYRGPVQFINCACFALEMAYIFQRRKVPHKRVGVIAACEGSWMSMATLLLRQVAEAWQKGTAYTPGYMGETYFLPDRKSVDGGARIFLERGRIRGRWQAFGRILFRPTLGMLSLIWPLEHSTYFSRRWGASFDHLVTQHLQPVKPRVRVSLEDRAVAEMVRMLPRLLPRMQEILIGLHKFHPPR